MKTLITAALIATAPLMASASESGCNDVSFIFTVAAQLRDIGFPQSEVEKQVQEFIEVGVKSGPLFELMSSLATETAFGEGKNLPPELLGLAAKEACLESTK